MSKTTIPKVGDIPNFLKQAKHSTLDPDGIPYRCWLVSGEKANQVIHYALIWTYDGKPAADDFNDK